MDWINTFMLATEGIRTPPIFRLWAGLTTIAGVLQRRVYTYTEASSNPLCPNIWAVLVGPPATGKGIAISETRSLWNQIKGFHIASDNVTHASFIAELESSSRVFMNGGDEISIFSSVSAPIAEFGVFIPKYDMEFLSVLSHIYDNPDTYAEPRTSVASRKVDHPNFNMLGGVTPDTLGDIFPEAAWGQGFTSRLIFIYSDLLNFDNKNYFRKRKANVRPQLLAQLEKFFELGGEFEWSPEAQEAHIAWLDAGKPGAPEHGRLKHYASRRDVHIAKLAMISSISANNGLYVTIEDYERAHEWLSEAELVMPDIFRAMGQKSDAQLIADLHYHLYLAWSRHAHASRLPLEDKMLWEFLKERVPSPQIPKIIETAERSGLIRRAPGSGLTPRWIPRPLNEGAPL